MIDFYDYSDKKVQGLHATAVMLLLMTALWLISIIANKAREKFTHHTDIYEVCADFSRWSTQNYDEWHFYEELEQPSRLIFKVVNQDTQKEMTLEEYCNLVHEEQIELQEEYAENNYSKDERWN